MPRNRQIDKRCATTFIFQLLQLEPSVFRSCLRLLEGLKNKKLSVLAVRPLSVRGTPNENLSTFAVRPLSV